MSEPKGTIWGNLEGKAGSSDVLRLCIGGSSPHHVVDVTRRTLTCIQGSVLAEQFSGRYDDVLSKNADGHFFIDQPYDLFAALIDFLQRKCSESMPSSSASLSLSFSTRLTSTTTIPPATPPTCDITFHGDETRYRDFLRLLDHYGLTHGVFSYRVTKFFGLDEDFETPYDTYHPGMTITADRFCAMKLVPVTPKFRKVHRFTVQAKKKDVKELQVGFVNVKEPPTSLVGDDDGLDGHPPRIGTFAQSAGFDLRPFGTYTETVDSFQKIDRQAFGIDDDPVITITCVRVGVQYYVNGKRLETELCAEDDADVPAISGIGTWQIMELLLEEDEAAVEWDE